VRAYLDIESLRLGDRLKVEETIDPGLLKALMPPFSFQPLVENAVQHGLHSSPRAGRLQLIVGRLFQLEVRSEIGEGTTVTMRIPLRKQFGVGQESQGSIAKNHWVPELPGMR
jgi:sensor histidine kinase YesM